MLPTLDEGTEVLQQLTQVARSVVPRDPVQVRAYRDGAVGFDLALWQRFAELGWPNTPLADYLDVDFELESTSMTLMSPWAERHQLGHISPAELDDALNSHWNVVDEITMVVRRV